jgi:protein-S-isoprenylcysteine O-methyltransferase Ste14
MYVGFSCWLIAWALLLANLYVLSLIIGFIFYIDRYQIKPEEKILEDIFGDDFVAYKTRVRRWL